MSAISYQPPTDEEARAALRFFFKVAPRWRLTDEEARTLLGAPPVDLFEAWRRGEEAAISSETMQRLGDFVAVSIAAGQLFTELDRGYEWLRKPNKTFAGQSALDVMLSGRAGLTQVRQYIEAEIVG